MFRRFDIRIFLILFLNAAYVYMLSVLNTEIAPAAYVVLPAIFIIPAALFLNIVQMIDRKHILKRIREYLCFSGVSLLPLRF